MTAIQLYINNMETRGGSPESGKKQQKHLAGERAVADLDAITGATKSTTTLGFHAELQIKNIYIETGIDYVSFEQAINYAYASGAVSNLNFHFQQLRLPLTTNFYCT